MLVEFVRKPARYAGKDLKSNYLKLNFEDFFGIYEVSELKQQPSLGLPKLMYDRGNTLTNTYQEIYFELVTLNSSRPSDAYMRQ